MKKFILILFLLTLGALPLKAGLVINELLSNEPSSSVTLEWIELYNDSTETVSLASYQLAFSSGAVNLPDSVNLAPREYYIICRKLYAEASTPGFESFWGDSSGIWGDTPEELELQTPYEMTFSLSNSANQVVLLKDGSGVSALNWTAVGLDGYSWEKIAPSDNSSIQTEFYGGTPGEVNSVSPLFFDLAIDSAKTVVEDGTTFVDYFITNKGINNVFNASVMVYNGLDLFDSFDIASIASGQHQVIDRSYNLNLMYLDLLAVLNSDDRLRNNELSFTTAGNLFPPLVINEFMPNPDDDLKTEWIELKNISAEAVDLSGWMIGDELAVHLITAQATVIPPGGYVVLADTIDWFYDFYTDFNGLLIQPTDWATLNNNGDVIRLVDANHILADSVAYVGVFDNFATYGRNESVIDETKWGESVNPFGTPGEENEVRFDAEGADLIVQINPTHISPDDDGVDDEMLITIDLPSADAYTIKIYDRQGRSVKTFYDSATGLSNNLELTWNGRSDAGLRLPIGIYILYIEAENVTSQKQTVVIAR